MMKKSICFIIFFYFFSLLNAQNFQIDSIQVKKYTMKYLIMEMYMVTSDLFAKMLAID